MRLWCQTPELSGECFELVEPIDGKIVLSHDGVVFGDLGMLPTQLFEHERVRPLPLILDVHFPFYAPEQIFPMPPDGLSIEDMGYSDQMWGVQQFWANPDTYAAAVALVKRADIVTTPYEMWAREIRQFNPRVAVLPDCHDPRTAQQFMGGFLRKAFNPAVAHWGHSYVSRKTRARMRLSHLIALPHYWLVERRKMRDTFATLPWSDWRE